MASGCLKCMKCLCCCLIVITNIVVALIGLIVFLLGLLFAIGFSMLSSLLTNTLGSTLTSITDTMKSQFGMDLDIMSLLSQISAVTGGMGAVFIVLGLVLIVLACLGCCGACCTVKPCLIIYGVGTLLIMLAQVVVIIIWFANADVLKTGVKDQLNQNVRDFYGLNSTNIRSLVQNVLQIFVGCCGVDNGTDFWTMSPNWNKQYEYTVSGYTATIDLTYPISCCKFNLSSFKPADSYCMYNNTTPETNNYQIGCYDRIFTLVNSAFQLNTIFYILIGIIGFQLLLVIGAFLIIYADRQNSSSKVSPK